MANNTSPTGWWLRESGFLREAIPVEYVIMTNMDDKSDNPISSGCMIRVPANELKGYTAHRETALAWVAST